MSGEHSLLAGDRGPHRDRGPTQGKGPTQGQGGDVRAQPCRRWQGWGRRLTASRQRESRGSGSVWEPARLAQGFVATGRRRLEEEKMGHLGKWTACRSPRHLGEHSMSRQIRYYSVLVLMSHILFQGTVSVSYCFPNGFFDAGRLSQDNL